MLVDASYLPWVRPARRVHLALSVGMTFTGVVLAACGLMAAPASPAMQRSVDTAVTGTESRPAEGTMPVPVPVPTPVGPSRVAPLTAVPTPAHSPAHDPTHTSAHNPAHGSPHGAKSHSRAKAHPHPAPTRPGPAAPAPEPAAGHPHPRDPKH